MSVIDLRPFSKKRINQYIDKFMKMNKKSKWNENLSWTTQQYAAALKKYPSLYKMMEEPFLLRMILTILPSFSKQYPLATKISKAQVYEAFNKQWIDSRVKKIANQLKEMHPQKIKFAFQQYCQELAFEMFIQGNQTAIENDKEYKKINICTKPDPTIEMEIKCVEKKSKNMNLTQNVWERYFNGDSIAKYVLRRVGDNEYQFLHKSCQEYYASQKIIFDIISWTSDMIDIDDQEFQKQFEQYIPNLSINCKLLNEEIGIIQFIAERIHDTNKIYTNLESRLFRIIKASKNSEHINIAAANAITILNSANVNMNDKDWSNIKIPGAILDRAFLEGTNFTNANLDNVHFVQACLNKANFTNASMKG
ncbi:hypothetical protein RFI_05935, partial [Reticulomyxa filosa]